MKLRRSVLSLSVGCCKRQPPAARLPSRTAAPSDVRADSRRGISSSAGQFHIPLRQRLRQGHAGSSSTMRMMTSASASMMLKQRALSPAPSTAAHRCDFNALSFGEGAVPNVPRCRSGHFESALQGQPRHRPSRALKPRRKPSSSGMRSSEIRRGSRAPRWMVTRHRQSSWFPHKTVDALAEFAGPRYSSSPRTIRARSYICEKRTSV